MDCGVMDQVKYMEKPQLDCFFAAICDVSGIGYCIISVTYSCTVVPAF
jgi:hypothetical protein